MIHIYYVACIILGLDSNQKGPIERGPEVGGVVRAAGPHVVDAVVVLRHLEPL